MHTALSLLNSPVGLMLVAFASLVALGCLPHLIAWLKGHNHPLAAEVGNLTLEVLLDHEHGESVMTAIRDRAKSPEAIQFCEEMLSCILLKKSGKMSGPGAPDPGTAPPHDA